MKECWNFNEEFSSTKKFHYTSTSTKSLREVKNFVLREKSRIVLLTHPYKFDYSSEEFTKIRKKYKENWNPYDRIDN
jgi:hypothetical protein